MADGLFAFNRKRRLDSESKTAGLMKKIEGKTVAELRKTASEIGVKDYTKLSKAELVKAIIDDYNA